MATQSARDRIFRLYEFSRPFVDEVADRTKHMYEDAREWVPEHRTAVATVSAVATGGCVLGYLLGRGARQGQPRPEHVPSVATGGRTPVPDLDIRPLFRLVSLWMLYRVATRD
nr:hypothetical protein FLJDLJJJ_00035 [uncultured bacterium]